MSMLTASEWEVVLRGFVSSTVIKVINLHFSLEIQVSTWISDEEEESFCLQIGRILNSSSVQVLNIHFCQMFLESRLRISRKFRF
ncbi:hypothetical protein MPTK1_1g23160 [Marchantia polymorpha subsp. ruderalis]